MLDLNIPFYYICVASYSIPSNNHKRVENLYPGQAIQYIENYINKFRCNNAVIHRISDNKYKVIPDGLRDPIVVSVQFDLDEFKKHYAHYWYKLTVHNNNKQSILHEALKNHECINIDSLIDQGIVVNTKLLLNSNSTNPLIIEDSLDELEPIQIKLGDLLYKCITSNVLIPITFSNLHIFALGETRYNKQQLLSLIDDCYLTVDCILTVSKNKYLIVIDDEKHSLLFDAFNACLGKVYKLKYANFKYATIEYINI